MHYEPKNFDHLIGTLGFSDQLLKNHFTLYQGYVTNINKLTDELAALTKDGKTATPGFAELKRRFGWEWNGMKLHELYFGNMSKVSTLLKPEILNASEGSKNSTTNQSNALHKKIVEQFGSFEHWEKDFRAVATMRGIGWAVLYHDPASNELFNVWVNEHDMGHLTGCTPLLVLDVFEHAYVLDYDLKRADYIEAFMKAVDWEEVEKRLK